MRNRIYIMNVESGPEDEAGLHFYCLHCAKDEGYSNPFDDCVDVSDGGHNSCEVCNGDRCPSCGSDNFWADNGYPVEKAICDDCAFEVVVR